MKLGIDIRKNYKKETQAEKSELKQFLTVLYTQESFKSFRNIFDFDKLRKEDYLNTLLEVTSDFKPDISSTFRKFAVLREVITELGICYSYNSELSIYNSPRYWKDKQWGMVDTSKEILRVTSTMATPRKYSKAMGIAQAQLNVMNLYTTDDVKPLKPTQRNCRLPHESNLAHSPVYKILETLYDKMNNKKLCNCAPNCDEDRSFLESYDTGDWWFGSSVQWTLSKFPKIRYKRDLLFGLTDVLIYVGGMAGLFLGCGVLSFVEIVYFLTLKLYWYIYKNRTTQRDSSANKLKQETLRNTKFLLALIKSDFGTYCNVIIIVLTSVHVAWPKTSPAGDQSPVT
ncbi:pickpocket 9 [Carabus blaptoides fortunei]